MFGLSLGRASVDPIRGHDELLQYSFQDRTADVQLQFDREDRFRELHGLAQVIRPETDLRLCRDSTHSSDVAFLPMTSTEWQALEAKFGVDKVAARFLRMEWPLEEFLKVAFAPASGASRGKLMPDLLDWEGGTSYQPNTLEYTLVLDGYGRPRLEVLRTIVLRYLEAGPVTVSFWRTPSRLSVDRDTLVKTVADRIGQLQIRVSNSLRTGFVVIEPNGVAAGWRTDEWRPADERPKKPWKFWRRRDKHG